MKTSRNFGFDKRFLFGGAAVLVVFVTVLGLAILRVQDLTNVLQSPEAAGRNKVDTVGCNPNSPPKVWSCFQNGINGIGKGNCAYCLAQNGDGETPPPAGGQTHLECAAMGTDKVKLNDSAPEIKYSGPWTYAKGSGGTTAAYKGDYHYAPGPLSSATVSKNLGASATLSFNGQQVAMRALSWLNRGNIDIFIDEAKVDSVSGYTGGAILPIDWKSAVLGCGEHTIKISQSEIAGKSGGRLVALDYFEVFPCAAGGFSCKKVAGAGENKDGCTAVGAECATIPSRPKGQVDACWGNAGSDGKCYDCNGDGEINILDFSCFAKHWLNNVL